MFRISRSSRNRLLRKFTSAVNFTLLEKHCTLRINAYRIKFKQTICFISPHRGNQIKQLHKSSNTKMKQVIFIKLRRILKLKLNANLVSVNGVKERKFIFKFPCISSFVSSHVLFFVLELNKAKDKQTDVKITSWFIR